MKDWISPEILWPKKDERVLVICRYKLKYIMLFAKRVNKDHHALYWEFDSIGIGPSFNELNHVYLWKDSPDMPEIEEI